MIPSVLTTKGFKEKLKYVLIITGVVLFLSSLGVSYFLYQSNLEAKEKIGEVLEAKRQADENARLLKEQLDTNSDVNKGVADNKKKINTDHDNQRNQLEKKEEEIRQSDLTDVKKQDALSIIRLESIWGVFCDVTATHPECELIRKAKLPVDKG